MSAFLAPVVSVIAGGVLATVTVVGLVSSQTSAPSESPADVQSPVVDYGSTN